jgi:hypothetical protein
MSLNDYKARLRRLNLPIGVALFTPLIVGVLGSLYLTTKLAESSSWNREWVFMSMLPTLLAPIFMACAIAKAVDRRMGIKCECGQSLSFGPHVARLMNSGGECPRCGRLVVAKEEPGPSRDS